MSGNKCPKCGHDISSRSSEWTTFMCGSHDSHGAFAQTVTCKLRVAEKRIETLERERDDYRSRWQGVMDKAMDTWRELDAAKQRIETLEAALHEAREAARLICNDAFAEHEPVNNRWRKWHRRYAWMNEQAGGAS